MKGVTKKGVLAVLACLMCVAVLSCASNKKKSDEFKDIDNAVEQQNFDAGIESIVSGQETGRGQNGKESGRRRARYGENNSISLFLDKGLLEHYGKKYDQSSNDLQEAERLIEEAYTKSVAADVASYIANDNTKEYPGEDFEDIYLNIFNALNYYNAGKLDGAMVEIRKLTLPNGKLDMLGRKYDEADKKAENSSDLNNSSAKNSSAPKVEKSQFSNSALAHYLGALFFQASGNTNGADIEFKQIQAAFDSNKHVYQHSVPKAVQEAQNIPAGKARLNIISFTGMSPIKEEEVIKQNFPFFIEPVLRNPVFKLPKMVRRQNHIDNVEIIVGNDKFHLELLEDMGAVVEETFKSTYSRVVFKTYARTMIKYTAVDVAAKLAKDNLNKIDDAKIRLAASLTVMVAPLALKAAFDESEGADIRMSRYLPEKAYIGGINLAPGTYTVTINYCAGSKVLRTETCEDVEVKATGLNLVESVRLR